VNATKATAAKATARAHANIALVKYWGKRDATLNLPAAGSLSATLAGMTTTTTVALAADAEDELSINGERLEGDALKKAKRVLDPIRERAGLEDHGALIESRNDFPTAAGLASSASGLAALAVAAAKAAGLSQSEAQLSALARRGSGSASRSIFGGFALWRAGVRADGEDSCAEGLYGPDYWPLSVLIAVISGKKKPKSSTSGMTHTAKTSPYHQPFLHNVDRDLQDAQAALAQKDFAALGRVAERSCLRMHADMLAADPPLSYLLPESWRVISRVWQLRDAGLQVFFTADAGPNVKVFCAPASSRQRKKSCHSFRRSKRSSPRSSAAAR
jgi:diphosphomevalonate decarboxylase